MTTGNNIFISYSHKDRKLFEEFNTMLAPAVMGGRLDVWHDQQLPPGARWKEEIEKALASARIAVLLVSQNFLASRFIMQQELPPLLDAARRNGVVIFWIYLSSCLYEQTEIASYQAAHDISRPLDILTKPQRQGVLSEVCFRLVRLVQAPTPGVKSEEPPSPAAAGGQDRRLECFLLLTEALQEAERAAMGGGPSTTLHRRAKLARQWLEQGAKLLPDCRGQFPEGLAQALGRAAERTIPNLIGWSRSLLPEPGSTEHKTSDSDAFRDSKHEAYWLRNEIEKHIEADPQLAALRGSDRKWSILGFSDEEDLEDFLYPPISRVVQNTDPMQRDLLERLLDLPEFTPGLLHQQGYRKDIVMDSLNALLREKWAEWTDLTQLDDEAKGRMTGVGKRLLKQMLERRPAHSESLK
jgi:hypothetical protein